MVVSTSLIDPVTSGRAARPAGSCSGRTRPTSAGAGPSPSGTSPTTRGGPLAAAGSSSPRRRASTRRTGRTSARRWPRSAGRAGRGRRRPADRTARSCSPASAMPAAGLRRTRNARCGRRRRCRTRARARCPRRWSTEIDAVVAGFAAAAALAAGAGLEGVEINAGQHSLLRQFLSGLTNLRGDDYGRTGCSCPRGAARRARRDRRRPGPRAAAVLRRARPVGRAHPGEPPPSTPRGWPGWSTTSPSCAARSSRSAPPVPTGTRRRLQHRSRPQIRDRGGRRRAGGAARLRRRPRRGQAALDAGAADLVEMTRAQIADPDLATQVPQRGRRAVRPCILCNQTCLVRDPRNPLVTCVVEPRSGHETRRRRPTAARGRRSTVLVVGAGPAGLEAARVRPPRGHRVRVAERGPTLRRHAAAAARVPDASGWPLRRLARSGNADASAWRYRSASRSPRPSSTTRWPADAAWCWPRARCPAHAEYRRRRRCAVVGGRRLVGLANSGALDRCPTARSWYWTRSAGRSGSASPRCSPRGRSTSRSSPPTCSSARSWRFRRPGPGEHPVAGGRRDPRSAQPAADGSGDQCVLEDRFTGEQREVGLRVRGRLRAPAARPTLWLHRPGTPRAGDAVAPRTIYEAVLEARRARSPSARPVSTPTRPPASPS